jgi:hypothetical protein
MPLGTMGHDQMQVKFQKHQLTYAENGIAWVVHAAVCV